MKTVFVIFPYQFVFFSTGEILVYAGFRVHGNEKCDQAG